MKVYNVHVGCKYEGGNTVGLFISKELALKSAYKLAKAYSDRMLEFQENEKATYPSVGDLDWSMYEIENGYMVGHDIYIVDEMEVQE